jgi:hypothetical protein
VPGFRFFTLQHVTVSTSKGLADLGPGPRDRWGEKCGFPERLYRPNRKPPELLFRGVSEGKAGGGLLSRNLSVAVPSALQGLTAVFGMGTGVAPAR